VGIKSFPCLTRGGLVGIDTLLIHFGLYLVVFSLWWLICGFCKFIFFAVLRHTELFKGPFYASTCSFWIRDWVPISMVVTSTHTTSIVQPKLYLPSSLHTHPHKNKILNEHLICLSVPILLSATYLVFSVLPRTQEPLPSFGPAPNQTGEINSRMPFLPPSQTPCLGLYLPNRGA